MYRKFDVTRNFFLYSAFLEELVTDASLCTALCFWASAEIGIGSHSVKSDANFFSLLFKHHLEQLRKA
jgi:hypothetical protein